MKKLFLFIAAALVSTGMWATSTTVGITTTTSTTSGAAGTARTITGATNLTVTHQLNSGTSGALSEYSNGDKEMYYASNTKKYSKGAYKWNKSVTDDIITANNFVGYSVTVASGYTYSLSSLSFQIASSTNYTYKIMIYNSSSTAVYTGTETTISNYNSSSATGYSQEIDLSGVSGVQNLTNTTFYVRVYLKASGTGKYLCFPEFTITGDLAGAQSYTVTYKANGGTGADKSESTSQVAANTFTKDGYRFVGWNTQADGNGDAYEVGDLVSSNLTLFAQWAKLYSVTYNGNGAEGDAPEEDDHIAGETFDVAGKGTLVAPDGKAFGGWTYNTTDYAEGADFTMPAANVEFMIKWIDAITPTITFNDGAYTVSNQTLDLSSLFTSNSEGAVTYSVKTDGGTTATINGTTFYAAKAGSCVVTASQAAVGAYLAATADATITVTENKNLLVMVRLSGTAGANKTYSGTASENVTATAQCLESNSPYKLASNYRSCVGLTLSEGYFQAGDSIVMDLSTTGKMYCGTLPPDESGKSSFPAGSTELGETTKSGIQYFILPNDLPENTTIIYTARPSSTYNGTLTYMAVFRDNGGTTALDNTADEVKAVKFFENGQLFIEKNGHVYNAMGVQVR